MTIQWVQDAFFYHVYPLGLCGAPYQNDVTKPPEPRLEVLLDWIEHIRGLGATAVYFGPVFQANTHGYDTINYFEVDRRLGTVETLKKVVGAFKEAGLRVIFDAVFNHVARQFWAFEDLLKNQRESGYIDWFRMVNFDETSPEPFKDPFSYEAWEGNFDMPRLNLDNPDARQHVFDAVTWWVKEFDIDGLRIDAAEHMPPEFFKMLRRHVDALKPDFWMTGETLKDHYEQWANPEMLNSASNYECFKGLYSSHNDHNYPEIAHSLNRQFGPDGIYRGITLYNFVDNHDQPRIASNLNDTADLYPVHGILFTMPGVPSVYYGSEWGIQGRNDDRNDRNVRPAIDIHTDPPTFPHTDLADSIRQLMAVRQNSRALKVGDYQERYLQPEQLAFSRSADDETVIVAVNAAGDEVEITIEQVNGGQLVDLLNDDGAVFPVQDGRATVNLPPNWLRIMRVE